VPYAISGGVVEVFIHCALQLRVSQISLLSWSPASRTVLFSDHLFRLSTYPIQ
jgi:hypothetical protein